MIANPGGRPNHHLTVGVPGHRPRSHGGRSRTDSGDGVDAAGSLTRGRACPVAHCPRKKAGGAPFDDRDVTTRVTWLFLGCGVISDGPGTVRRLDTVGGAATAAERAGHPGPVVAVRVDHKGDRAGARCGPCARGMTARVTITGPARSAGPLLAQRDVNRPRPGVRSADLRRPQPTVVTLKSRGRPGAPGRFAGRRCGCRRPTGAVWPLTSRATTADGEDRRAATMFSQVSRGVRTGPQRYPCCSCLPGCRCSDPRGVPTPSPRRHADHSPPTSSWHRSDRSSRDTS